MSTINERIAALRQFFKDSAEDRTMFIVEGGDKFYTTQEAFDYLFTHGAHTPDGRRIIDYPISTQGFDALSMSLYELIIEGIKNDGFDIGELVSDAVE